MAIEAALLRETLSKPSTHQRWIDGSQNLADVLTKLNVDESYFLDFMRTAKWTLTQNPLAAAAKEKKHEAKRGRKTQAESNLKEELRSRTKATKARPEIHQALHVVPARHGSWVLLLSWLGSTIIALQWLSHLVHDSVAMVATMFGQHGY